MATTVAFADLSGSTALFESLGDVRATEVITRITQWMGEVAQEEGGRVVKKLGDGVLMRFEQADLAVHAAAQLLRRHEQHLATWAGPQALQLRVGLASGQVVEVEGDCYGEAVNVAARLCERAGPSEIWATEGTLVRAPQVPQVRYHRLGTLDIRGKVERLVLYRVDWRDAQAGEAVEAVTQQAQLVSQFATAEAMAGRIDLSWPDGMRSFGGLETPVLIGRSPEQHVWVSDPHVSRQHARIDWRGTAFTLTDTSSFGTWLWFDGADAPVVLRRDSCILHGRGRISLGMAFGTSAETLLQFSIRGASVLLG